MEDLRNHIKSKEIILLHKGEFNNATGAVYNVIGLAVYEKADTIKMTETSLVWSREGIQIGDFNVNDKRVSTSHLAEFHNILDRDKVVQRYLHPVSKKEDEIICEIVHD